REGEHIQDFETVRFRKDGRRIHVSLTVSPIKAADGGIIGVSKIARNITQRKAAEEERERLLGELREALDHIKTLRGMLPICASCKNVRNDQGYWDHIENYIQEHSEARVTHGICPECYRKLYPHLMDKTAATPTDRLPPKP
ncbi:MAG: PAS domain S-box protein, partial [Nitrospirales bacterium]